MPCQGIRWRKIVGGRVSGIFSPVRKEINEGRSEQMATVTLEPMNGRSHSQSKKGWTVIEFGSRGAAQGRHAAPDEFIQHVLMYRRIYADPTQSAACSIDVNKVLARFGRGHLDDSSKVRAGTTPVMRCA